MPIQRIETISGYPGQDGWNSILRLAGVLTTRCFLLVWFSASAFSQTELAPFGDVTLATDALLMPRSAPYGRSINGVSFQSENITTIGNYQYSTWYRAQGTSNEDVMLARRNLSSGSIEIMDTGRDLVNGDNNWDAHNVISMGISTADDRIHLSYDHHGHQLNYTPSVVGAATGATWDDSILQAERPSLNVGGSSIEAITYPRYIPTPSGGLDMTYRTGSSGNGNLYFATYDGGTGLWNNPRLIITGTNGLAYTDVLGTSTSRNAYLNGVNYDQQGNIHVTWTWREDAGGSNHDIMYAYSDDGGLNWKNNAGTIIAGPSARGKPIDLNSPGIIIDDGDAGNGLLGQLNRTNTLMNQQAQTVDPNGFVHVVMWHKTDDAPAQFNPPFTTAPAAYYHYFRDPATGSWSRGELPTSREVGSRSDIAYDELGNIYVTYLSPGPGDGAGVLDYYTEGDLIIAGATRAAGYSDWTILSTDTRDFASEPFIDQNRLLDSGVLSVFVQENDDASTGRTGTPLHVIEYQASAALQWTGDDTGDWDEGSGSGQDWNSRGETTGNARFYHGYQVRFTDSGATSNVNIAQGVAPGKTTFENSAVDYTLSGAAIEGNGGLVVRGGGHVTLANAANTFSGATTVENGSLALNGDATLAASSIIAVHSGATLDVSGLISGFQLTPGQRLQLDHGATVQGSIEAMSSSVVEGAGQIVGNLTLKTGAVLELALFTPVEQDLLEVTGQVDLGGTLVVSLLDGAPEPQGGDSFDILDFAAATGSFSSYELPALPSGLVWNVSELGTTGELQVVFDVDLDDDGDVDGQDFLILQRTDPGLLPHWQNLYGKQLIGANVLIAAVPEPSTLVLAVGLALAGRGIYRTRRLP